MNRNDATPTSAPRGGWTHGAGRAADAEGHRFAWHPVNRDDPNQRRVTDEKVRPDAGIRL